MRALFYAQCLLLSEGDLHGRGGRDFEALERVSGRGRLHLVLELDKGDVVPARNQSHLKKKIFDLFLF